MLFGIRLIEFVYGTWSTLIGFVPDIANMRSKVEECLLSYDRIPKVQLKQFVRNVTESYYKNRWRQNLNKDPKLGHYSNIDNNNGIHLLWNISVIYPCPRWDANLAARLNVGDNKMYLSLGGVLPCTEARKKLSILFFY